MYLNLKILLLISLLMFCELTLAESKLLLPEQSTASNTAVKLEITKLQYLDSISGVKPLESKNQFLVIDITLLNVISPELVFDHNVYEKLVFHHFELRGPYLQWNSEQVIGRFSPKQLNNTNSFPDPAYINYEGDSLSGQLVYEVPSEEPNKGATLIWPDDRFDLIAIELFDVPAKTEKEKVLYESNGEYQLRLHDIDIRSDGIAVSLSGYRTLSTPTVMSVKGTARPVTNLSGSRMFVDGAAIRPKFPGGTSPLIFVADKVLTHRLWFPVSNKEQARNIGLVLTLKPPEETKHEPYWILPLKGKPSITQLVKQGQSFVISSKENEDTDKNTDINKQDKSIKSEDQRIQALKNQNERRRSALLSCEKISSTIPEQMTTDQLLLSNITFDGQSCIDVYPGGDGWGWNGETACRPNGHIYFFEDFEDEIALWPISKLNYLPFSDFCIQGAVDLLKDKQYLRKDRKPLTCHGGQGCVDLDGSMYVGNPVAVMTSRTIEIDPGEYELKFDVSGNLRKTATERISFSFEPHLSEVTFVVESEMKVKTERMRFSVEDSTQSKLVVKLLEAADYVGPIIDNIEISLFRENGWLSVVSHSPDKDNSISSPTAGFGAIEIIFDASGSMWKKMSEGKTRIDVARSVMKQLVENYIPDDTVFALRVFGNRKARSCRTDLEYSLAPLDRKKVLSKIQNINPQNRSKTPIADSLIQVQKDLKDATGNRIVVLLTDGEETCDGDPREAIQQLKSQGFDVQINIVGFAITDKDLKKQFEEYAKLGGGQYFEANNENDLRESLASSLKPLYRIYNSKNDLVAEGRVNDDGYELMPGVYRVEFSDKSKPVKTIEIISGDKQVIEY